MKEKRKLGRELLGFLLALAMVVGLMPGMSMTARADGLYGGGDGTENNPYAIETLEHLQQLKDSVNNGTNYKGTFFILKNSISISDSEWTPIGTATCTTSGNSWFISSEKPFQGTFDGNNNEISGLSITGDKNVQGLFGYVGNNGKVKNLIVSGSVKGNVLIGGIVGYNKGTVSGCHNKVAVGAKGLFHDTGNKAGGGGVVGTNEGTVKGCTNSGLITGITAHATKKGCYKDGTNIGGVVGGNSGTVTECWNTGTVNAAGNTGGVLGANYGTLSKSYNAGDVAGTSWSVAGLLGINRSGGVVENCYNTGTLNSTGVGNSGIVGTQQSSKDIKNCYNYGTVKLGDGENYGQIIGGSSGKMPSYCYYPSNLASVNLNTNGGSPLSDEQFAKKESFSGWDFSDVWYLDNGVRPLLKAIPETIPNKPGFEYDTEKKKLKITVDSEDTTIYYTKDGKRPEVTSETIQNGGTIDDLEGGETINVILMKENAVLMSTSYVCPYTVTYKVVNGTWSDDSTADRTEAVVSGLKPASVPTGMKASEGFAGGEWDEDPSNTTITEGKIFTYTFTAKATVTQAPTSKDPTYTGEPQGIIYPGTANGGTMQYAIGTNNSEPPTSGWSESIPTATEAGTYYVWYKVIGDENHSDFTADKAVLVEIKADTTAPTGEISIDTNIVNLPVGYVTDITKNSATLNMQLSAAVQSEVRTAGFEYKKKADADTAWTKVEGDFASGTVTKKLTSLTAGTDYVFRPYVTYTNDTMDTGAEINFTTDTKPAVTGSIAVKVKNETDGTKDVIVTIEEGNYALASQEKDGIAAGEEVTTGKFKELPDGTYNIVIKSKDGEFVETKMITIANGAAETISFTISKGVMKTDVEVEADTPKVAVDGLSKEELVQSGTITSEEETKVERGDISLEVTLKAEKKETSKVETKTVSAIQQVMAESSTKLVVDMFLDLSLFKTVTQLTGDQAGKTAKTDVGSTNTKVLEIAVPYDTTIKGLVVYRYHGSAASALKKLSSAPAKGAAYEDGSFYLSDKYIHIFASGFSTYAIAKEEENSSGGSGGGGGTTPVTPGKITPSKPAAPTLDSKTDTSITVKTVAGQEYSRDGGKTWQTSGTFTGLTPETEYSIVTKIAATSTANESPVSDALKVTTDKKADSSTPTPGATDTPSTTTTPGATSAPADKVTKTEKAKAKLSLNAGLKVSYVGKKVTVKWGKVSKADRYVVYAAYCGPDKCTKIKTLSGSKASMTFTKLNGSKLNLKKNIKVYVVAYRKVNGKETKLARSITAHVVGTKNAKYTNVKKIKLSKSSYTLKVNKTATVKAEIVLEDKKKKQLSDGHAPEFRYASSNTKVATVDANGRIKAVGKGTCYIYVYAKNGYAKKIKIVVK